MGNLTSNLTSYSSSQSPPTMSKPEWSREREIAELAVLRASILTKKVLDSVQSIKKDDLTPVTVADFASQALLISAVEDAFPGHGVLGEEDSKKLRESALLQERVFGLIQSVSVIDPQDGTELGKPTSKADMMDMIDRGGQGAGDSKGFYWVMDPVDGTKAYIEGNQYAVSLALMKDHKEVLGVMGCPNLKLVNGRIYDNQVDKEGMGVILTAVKGQGVTVRNVSLDGKLGPAERITAHKAPSCLQDTHFVSCAVSPQINTDILDKLARRLNITDPGTDVWSSHMRYAALALGGADAQVRVPRTDIVPKAVRVWDHAGSQLIFTELGGKITDLDGKEMDFSSGRSFLNNRGMVIAKPEIHAQILAATREVLGEAPL